MFYGLEKNLENFEALVFKISSKDEILVDGFGNSKKKFSNLLKFLVSNFCLFFSFLLKFRKEIHFFEKQEKASKLKLKRLKSTLPENHQFITKLEENERRIREKAQIMMA